MMSCMIDSQNTPQTLLDVTQYARERGVRIPYVYLLLREGRIPGAHKVDKQWRIPAPENSKTQQ
jgi:hypothetical protein